MLSSGATLCIVPHPALALAMRAWIGLFWVTVTWLDDTVTFASRMVCDRYSRLSYTRVCQTIRIQSKRPHFRLWSEKVIYVNQKLTSSLLPLKFIDRVSQNMYCCLRSFDRHTFSVKSIMFLIGYHFSRKNIIFEGDTLNKVNTPLGKNDKKNSKVNLFITLPPR